MSFDYILIYFHSYVYEGVLYNQTHRLQFFFLKLIQLSLTNMVFQRIYDLESWMPLHHYMYGRPPWFNLSSMIYIYLTLHVT